MTTQGPALSIRHWPLAALLALVVWISVSHAQVRVNPELGKNSCEVADDCVAILCPCDWTVLAADNEEQLADCRKLQTISRCATILLERPKLSCIEGRCGQQQQRLESTDPGAASPRTLGQYGALAHTATDGGRGDSATEIVEAIITRVDDRHAPRCR